VTDVKKVQRVWPPANLNPMARNTPPILRRETPTNEAISLSIAITGINMINRYVVMDWYCRGTFGITLFFARKNKKRVYRRSGRKENVPMNISKIVNRFKEFRASGTMCDSMSMRARKKYTQPSAAKRRCLLLPERHFVTNKDTANISSIAGGIRRTSD
jgi:hypothetical protein